MCGMRSNTIPQDSSSSGTRQVVTGCLHVKKGKQTITFEECSYKGMNTIKFVKHEELLQACFCLAKRLFVQSVGCQNVLVLDWPSALRSATTLSAVTLAYLLSKLGDLFLIADKP